MRHETFPPPSRQKRCFWIAILILALVSSIALFSTYRLLTVISAASRTQQTTLELDNFMSDLKDVETGARSYALTHDDRFLEPYRSGRTDAGLRLNALENLARDEPWLARQVPRFRQLAQRRIGLAQQTIDVASNGSHPELVKAAALGGRAVMATLRKEVGAANAVLRSNYEIRRRHVQRETIIASISLGTGIVASALLLIWLFSLLNREATRRRQVEGDLRRLNAELEQRVQQRTGEVEEARRLLDAVIENIPDTVFLKDAEDEFRYIMVNRAGAELLGREPHEVIGRVDHELFPRDEAVLARNEDAEVIGPPPTNIVSERLITTAEGKRSLELRKIPFAVEDSGRRYVLGIARDLSEQKRLQTQVREMQRLESVGRLTGGIAHDFNNLLAVILGSVELIREKAAGGCETAELADEALEAVQRGADLVRRLLAFARKQHLEPTAIDLNERLPKVVPLLQRTLGEQIQVQVNSSDDLWQAIIDPTQVDDALVNLAINARDAMPNGGMLTIETDNVVLDEDYAAHHVEVEPGDYVMLAVSDTGTGMTPDVIARAFEPFFTTKPDGKGTGLGLSQVFGWVKQSGGHIKIYSEVRHGTTIKLYLPRTSEGAVRAEQGSAQEPELTGSETILLVEDNPNVRRTVKRQLGDLGYSVVEAEHAEMALEQIDAGVSFDLLLTDVVMPGSLSGYELADRVRQVRPNTRVLFTSGYTELAASGIDTSRKGPLLSKPYSKRELGRAVRSALENGSGGSG